MNIKLNFARREINIKVSKKRGRPKKTKLRTGWLFVAFLRQVYLDNRFRGNKISRVLRRIMETKNLKEVLGINLMAGVFLMSVLGQPTGAIDQAAEADPQALRLEAISITTQETVRRPLNSFYLTQGYSFYHPAIDLKETLGAPVYPVMAGTVKEVNLSRIGYGHHLIVNHGSGFQSLYAHLHQIRVKSGQAVNQETILGTVGSTGWSTGSHLHLEIWQNNRPINPLLLLK